MSFPDRALLVAELVGRGPQLIAGKEGARQRKLVRRRPTSIFGDARGHEHRNPLLFMLDVHYSKEE